MGRKKKRNNPNNESNKIKSKSVQINRFPDRLALCQRYYRALLQGHEWNPQLLGKESDLQSLKISASFHNSDLWLKRVFHSRNSQSPKVKRNEQFPNVMYISKELIAQSKPLQDAISANLLVKRDLASLVVCHFLSGQRNMNYLILGSGSGEAVLETLETFRTVHKPKRNRISQTEESKTNESDPKIESERKPKDMPQSFENGVLVVNELNKRLCSILRAKFAHLESSNVVLLNHLATDFPELKKTLDQASETKSIVYDSKLYFDRVLVNAPCSRDGLKSDYRRWKPENAFKMHHLQLDLLQKAISLAKVGASIVYATSSVNPLENEAVVAEVFRRANGATEPCLELQSVHGEFPTMSMERGLTRWKVFLEKGQRVDDLLSKRASPEHTDSPGQENSQVSETVNGYFRGFDTMREYLAGRGQVVCDRPVVASLFCQDHEELRSIGLHKTGRLYPTRYDHAPLYIAVIKKLSYVHFDRQFAVQTQTVGQSLDNQLNPDPSFNDISEETGIFGKEQFSFSNVISRTVQQNWKKKTSLNRNKLVSVISASDSEWIELQEQFKIDARFPVELLVKHSFNKASEFSVISPSVLSLLRTNVDVQMRKLFVGTRLFEKPRESDEQSVQFRPVHMGLPLLCEFLLEGLLQVEQSQFNLILKNYPRMTLQKCNDHFPDLTSKIRQFSPGFCFLTLKSDTSTNFGCEYLALEVKDDIIKPLISSQQHLSMIVKFGIK